MPEAEKEKSRVTCWEQAPALWALVPGQGFLHWKMVGLPQELG